MTFNPQFLKANGGCWLPLMVAGLAVVAVETADASAAPTIEGEFTVVALRRAAAVAGGSLETGSGVALGRRVSFGDRLEWFDGSICPQWSATVVAEQAALPDDRNLSDLQLVPNGVADARINRTLALTCDGRHLADVTQVDDRVLVAASPSGTTSIVMERVPDGADVEILRDGLNALGLLPVPAEGPLEDATRRALAVYADQVGADFAFARGVVTENLLAKLAVVAAARRAETLKTMTAGPVTARFIGTRSHPEPLEHGVRELWFEFEEDGERYRFEPAGELRASDWSFDVFSRGGTFALLPQDRHGPYHVVLVAHLKDYLRGRRKADDIVGGEAGLEAADRVLADARWLSDSEFSYTATCCGAMLRRKHSLRFLGYRPKTTPDTIFDYRPAISLTTQDLPPFVATDLHTLAAELAELIAAARSSPGRFEPGNTALGANPQEYVPSDEELLAARFGDALMDLLNQREAGRVEASWSTPEVSPRTLIYHRFIYRHVDVMGSGRFFYASPPIPMVIEIGRESG